MAWSEIRDEIPYHDLDKMPDFIADKIHEYEEKHGEYPKAGDFKDEYGVKTRILYPAKTYKEHLRYAGVKPHKVYGSGRENKEKPDGATIYVLECVRHSDGEIFYYVGSVVDMEVDERIQLHVYDYGDFSAPRDTGRYSKMMPKGEVDFWIIPHEKEHIEEDDKLDSKEFKRKILELERQKMLSLAIEKNTTNILGGR